jgi:hypothetical protein
MQTTRIIIYTCNKSSKILFYQITSAKQLESVLKKIKNLEYLQFLMNPNYWQNISRNTFAFPIRSEISVSNSGRGDLESVLGCDLKETFELAYFDPDLGVYKDNIKDPLLVNYLTMMFSHYETCFYNEHKQLIMSISVEDDIEDLPNGFESYFLDGKYRCYSLNNRIIAMQILSKVKKHFHYNLTKQ